MPIEAYLPTSGASFGPEAVTNMGKALDGAVDAPSGLGRATKPKREAVPLRFIIKLAEIDRGAWIEASLRDKVVMALGGSIHLSLHCQKDA